MAQLCSGEIPGWPGRRFPVASSDEIFFFFSFFFLFHFIEIFTAMGEEEERGRGKRAPWGKIQAQDPLPREIQTQNLLPR